MSDELVSALAGSILDMKRLRDRCLEAGIAAEIGCPGGGASCGPRTHLLVNEADLPRLGALLQDDWQTSLERDGLAPVVGDVSGEQLPCPACGTAAPLAEGACSDCGLQLET
jgi:hypothetical protein